MKATRDTQRRLATIPSPKEMHLPQGAAARAQTPWHATMLDVVYMIFLGYEAGRKAIDHLIEFEPAAAENTIVILITELTCYGLLLGNLKDDRLRYPRLKLRQEDSRKITPKLYREIDSRGHEELLPAQIFKVAIEMFGRRELDAFATNKAILFEMSDQMPGAKVLDGRWGVEHIAVAIPKGRAGGLEYLRRFVTGVQSGGFLAQAVERAGLRGSVKAE